MPVKPEITMMTEGEVALSEYNLEWLKKCDGPIGEMPGNEIGLLLQDYADLAKALAECRLRHNSSSEYLEKIVRKVKKEQGGKPASANP